VNIKIAQIEEKLSKIPLKHKFAKFLKLEKHRSR